MTPAIVSVSRRTDVPAFHADWFFRCLDQGWAMVQGPGGSRFVSLAQRDVAGFVFWTKNPAPMLDRLDRLGDVPFYFQFTLTSYGRDVEPGIPPKGEVLVPLFRQLSRQVGRRRVVWRYDPVFFSPVYTLDYHRRWFDRLAGLLGPYTDTCTVSFLDWYPVMERSMTQLGAQHETSQLRREAMACFAACARREGIRLVTCAQDGDFSDLGVTPGACVDPARLGLPPAGRDRSQRPLCRCAPSVDIGFYGSCRGGCRYCYAARGAY